MAEFERRVVRTERVEYVLRSPTNWAELGKAFAAIQQELGAVELSDDSVMVAAVDAEIVCYFEVKEGNRA